MVTDYLDTHRAVIVAALLAWVVLYLVYRFAWRRDFGIPVRRRLLALRLFVEREQVAYVPFWWNDVQVQRALDHHWQAAMRRSFERPTAAPHR